MEGLAARVTGKFLEATVLYFYCDDGFMMVCLSKLAASHVHTLLKRVHFIIN